MQHTNVADIILRYTLLQHGHRLRGRNKSTTWLAFRRCGLSRPRVDFPIGTVSVSVMNNATVPTRPQLAAGASGDQIVVFRVSKSQYGNGFGRKCSKKWRTAGRSVNSNNEQHTIILIRSSATCWQRLDDCASRGVDNRTVSNHHWNI